MPSIAVNQAGQKIYFNPATEAWEPYDDSPIHGPGQLKLDSFGDFAQSGLSGINEGIANTADIVGNPIAALTGAEQRPVYRGMEATGMLSQPETEAKLMHLMGRDVGAGGLMTLMTGGASKAAPVSQLIRDNLPKALGASGLSGLLSGSAEHFAGPAAGFAAGLLPTGMPAAAGKAAARGAFRGNRAAQVQQSVDDFQRAGTTPSVGQAAGPGGARYLERTNARLPGGYTATEAFNAQQTQDLERGVRGIAEGLAPRRGAETAGNAIVAGLEKGVELLRGKEGKLWSSVDNVIPLDTKTPAANLRMALDELSASDKFARMFANEKVQKAASTLDEMGSVSYDTLKQVRSTIGRRLGQPNLVDDIPTGELKKLYGAISQDIRDLAENVGGKQGLRLWQRANNYSRGLHERVGNTVQKLHRRGAEPAKLFDAVRRADVSTLRRMRKTMPQKEWNIFLGSTIDKMGELPPHMQNEAGDAFSIATYLTSWNKMGPEVRRVLFGGARFSRFEKDMNAIARAASEIKESAGVLSNPSGTGQTVLAGLGTGGLIYAALAGLPELAAGIGAGMAANYGLGRLMTSPRFVNWLAQTTKMPMDQLPAAIGRLNNVMQGAPDDERDLAADFVVGIRDAIQ